MTQRIRLNKFAAQLTEVGLAGGDMQSKLASLVMNEDLSPHEISRVVEKANRDVQLGLYKVAEDKRFSFKLLDAKTASAQARKQAEASMTTEADGFDKLAFAIDAAGGDPFAAPADAFQEAISPERSYFSLYDHPLDEKVAYAQSEHRTRELLLALDRQREELVATVKEAGAARVQAYDNATVAHKQTVQAALDMIGAGVTLPSLAMALYAAVSGSGSGPDAAKSVDNLLTLIVQGLKERGIPNHRLGFRWDADIDEIEKLSTEDIVAMAKRSAGLQCGGDLSLQTQKRAQRYIEQVPDYASMRPTGQHPFEDAADHLQNRPSVKDFGVPQAYLDDKNVSNTPNGRPKVVNGDSEFVIGIRDLMGAQDRLMRLHAANEYLGLKVKQIEGAMRGLKTAQLKAAEDLDSRLEALKVAEQVKESALPLVAGKALATLGGAAANAFGRGGDTNTNKKWNNTTEGGMTTTASFDLALLTQRPCAIQKVAADAAKPDPLGRVTDRLGQGMVLVQAGQMVNDMLPTGKRKKSPNEQEQAAQGPLA